MKKTVKEKENKNNNKQYNNIENITTKAINKYIYIYKAIKNYKKT